MINSIFHHQLKYILKFVATLVKFSWKTTEEPLSLTDCCVNRMTLVIHYLVFFCMTKTLKLNLFSVFLSINDKLLQNIKKYVLETRLKVVHTKRGKMSISKILSVNKTL